MISFLFLSSSPRQTEDILPVKRDNCFFSKLKIDGSFCKHVCQPHASVVCQGASPGGSVDRCLSDRPSPGFFVPSKAPRSPIGGDM